nr:MAG TPA: hypothetical protein [Caudoviricetes sp.]DAZ64373.1 MAG TPA: hypothetical protein [Caudoviricetes sp.]
MQTIPPLFFTAIFSVLKDRRPTFKDKKFPK